MAALLACAGSFCLKEEKCPALFEAALFAR